MLRAGPCSPYRTPLSNVIDPCRARNYNELKGMQHDGELELPTLLDGGNTAQSLQISEGDPTLQTSPR